MDHIEVMCYALLPYIMNVQDICIGDIHQLDKKCFRLRFATMCNINACSIEISYKNGKSIFHYSHQFLNPIIVNDIIRNICCKSNDEIYSIIIDHLIGHSEISDRPKADQAAIEYIKRYKQKVLMRRYNGFHDISIKTE